MKIEIAKHERMSERGSSLLRLIQNNDMPTLDLLVRESVQNSIDASLEGEGFTNINFSKGEFNSAELNKHFEGIESNLNLRYPENQRHEYMEIRDSNTTGLTGPLDYSEVRDNNFGNLLKLVYEISMPQQKEGSGGSWGLGKTVYFRIGIGLVIYYSRIKNDQGYFESRMAACLVEDETSDNALLHDPESMGLKRGIAWWGEGTGDNKTQPLTNESEIMEILNVLNIEPFKEEETGTSIILPYINEEKILESVTAKYKNTEKVPKWWETTVEDYIKVTVQRWYAPRIMNLNYPFGRALRPMINGRVINQDEMLPLFRIIQALYNKTPLRIGAEREDPILKGIKTNVEKVLLRNVFSKTGTAGYIAFTKLTREQLLMLAPDNHPSPLEQADIQEEFNGETNPPIITYVRKPGMLINYETSGPWVEGIGDSSEKEFLIGIFVANSENMLKDEIAKISLEEYIRKSEKADHTSWSNWNVGDYNPLIISKIQRQSKKHIRDQFTEVKKDSKENKKLGLGRALAEVLLPPEDFGSKSNVPRRTGVGGTSSSNKKSYGLKILGEPEFTEGEIELNFQLNFGKKTQTVDLELRVLSETGNILANSWEGESGIGTAFPLQITSIQLTKIFTGKEKHPEELTNFSFPVNMNSVSVKNLSFETLYTEEFGVPYGIKVSVPELTGYSIEGAVRFKTKQLKIQGILSVVKDEGGAS